MVILLLLDVLDSQGFVFQKKLPSIAQGSGPGLGPGPAGLTRGPGPGPGPAQRSPIVAPDYQGFIRLLKFHEMTRVS